LAEAAMIACNVPANINRKEFGFEKWKDWDAELFDNILESLLKKTREFHYTITGYDKAPSAVAKAKDNVRNANLDEYITITNENFFDSKKETEGPLHMVFNPPYGERMPIEIQDFYKNFLPVLLHCLPPSREFAPVFRHQKRELTIRLQRH
jgi:putative N6-adenine-specific DNA methylase